MKIHDKLWYIINPSREDNLAYMTYWEDDSKCQKRMETGRSWATPRKELDRETLQYLPSKYPEPVGVVVDNHPISGFNIGSSVCRWSTENKVFRVTDPRGFTVEVPTENISTLLHLTDVHKGIIQQECVWARDGNSHILLPVNSEPYLATLKDMDVLDKVIDIKDLKFLDKVKLYRDKDFRFIYIGQYKASWECKHIRRKYSGYDKREDTLLKNFGTHKDPKWQHYFLYKSTKGWEIDYLSNPKIVEAEQQDVDEDIALAIGSNNHHYVWCPDRVKKLVPEAWTLEKAWRTEGRIEWDFLGLGERRK